MKEKITKYYTYSDDLAANKGINTNKYLINFILIGLYSFILIIVGNIISFKFNNVIGNFVKIAAWVVVAIDIVYFMLSFSKIGAKNTAFAVSENNRIFYLKLILTDNHGNKVRIRFGDIYASSLYRELGNENTHNEANNYLKIPKMIDTMIEQAYKGIDGGEVYEIKDVYSIEKTNNSYIIKCDYVIMRINNIYNFTLLKNRTLEINEIYNNTEELIECLKKHIKS